MKKKKKQEKCYFPERVNLIRTKFSDKEKITIVNPDDFPLQKMLSIAGLDSLPGMLGITDSQEIKKRTQMFKFLRDHPEIEDFLASLRGGDYKIPGNQQQFLDFYNPKNEHNPYWDMLIKFVSFFKQYPDMPNILADFISHLENSFHLEKKENDFGQKISQELQKSSVITGIADFTLSLSIEVEDIEDGSSGKHSKPRLRIVLEECSGNHRSMQISEVTGYKAFSFALSDFRPLDLPSWSYKWWAKFLGLKSLMRKRMAKVNANRKQEAYKSMLFDSFGDKEGSVEASLLSSLLAYFNDMFFNDNIENENNPYRFLEDRLLDMPIHVQGKLSFRFDKGGLKLQVIDFQVTDDTTMPSPINLENSDLIVDNMRDITRFEAFTKEESRFLTKGAKSIASSWKSNLKLARMSFVLLWLNHINQNIFQPFDGKSGTLTRDYQWVFLENIYNSPMFKDLYVQLQQYRKFCLSGLLQLRDYLSINNRIVSFANKYDCPTTVPVILNDDQHVVEFQKLLPVNMLIKQQEKGIFGHKDAPKPVLINNFPQINGNIVFLTGYHGGGKTTAGQSALLMSYLALSGIPVWASSFKINRKTALGSIVSSEGAESTATVLLGKSTALAKTAAKLPNNQVLFFIDEIGKGTQEAAGIELGLDLMETFKGQGISLLVNSQIMRLAELAKTEYGAICLKVNDKHQFVPGIADGGMSQLRQKTGINKYLKKSKVTL